MNEVLKKRTYRNIYENIETFVLNLVTENERSKIIVVKSRNQNAFFWPCILLPAHSTLRGF